MNKKSSSEEGGGGIWIVIGIICIVGFGVLIWYLSKKNPCTSNVATTSVSTWMLDSSNNCVANVCMTGYIKDDLGVCIVPGTTPIGTTSAGTTSAGTTSAGTTPMGTTPMGTTPMGTTPIGTTPIGTTPIGTTTTPPRFPPNTYVSTSESGGHWCGPSKDYLNPSSDLSLDDCKFKCYTHMSSSDFGQNPYRNCSAFNFDPIDSKIGKCRLYTSEKQEPTVKKSHLNHDEKCFIDPKMSSKVANSAYNMELLSGGHPGGKWLTGTLTDGL